eukprot:COSAG04_NODE_8644_length_946_cov_2.242031_1_plen_176_part_01
MRLADQGQRPPASPRCPVLLFKLIQACWVHEKKLRPASDSVLDAIEKISEQVGALDDLVPGPVAEPEPQPAPEPEGEQQPQLLPWLTKVGLADKFDVVSNYVSSSTALQDLMRMLEVEQEDEQEEDLKDLVKDMGLDVETAAAFRAAIVSLAPTSPPPDEESQTSKAAAAADGKDA